MIGLAALVGSAAADDWPNWRGPMQNGVSLETGLVDHWSLDPKENVLWTSEIGGRATPIILNDRVYLDCRTHHDFNDPEEKIHCREQVVCFDAKSGDVVWRDEFNVFQSDIPAPRVGWASMCGDQETGNVYVHTVSGLLRCYSGDGQLVWERSMVEEYGEILGYGGRIQNPVVDEDRVIVGFLAANWGATKGPGPMHYYYAFDKKTGDLLWVSAPGVAPEGTNCSGPVVTVINNQRMFIAGNGDGGIYAINARTGQPIWRFDMSKAAINCSPTVDGNHVYITHGADNIDSEEFGRVQCIDATGAGDITKTHSVWRVDGIKAGFNGLTVHDGILYVVTDTGNLFAFDKTDGKQLWTHNLGTVGKSAPVIADGKLYVTEVNGKIHILEPSREGCKSLSVVHLPATKGTGDDEIYASPAISNGRIVFVTRDRTICIGKPDAAPSQNTYPPLADEGMADGEVATIQLRPYETTIPAGASQKFELHCFDKLGRFIKKVDPELATSKELEGLTISGASVTAPAVGEANADRDFAGTVETKLGELTASARIRVFKATPDWKWDFEGFTGPQVPPTWMRAFAKLKPQTIDGNTVMTVAGMGANTRGRPSHFVFLGSPSQHSYTIQADVLMKEQRRQLPNIGVCANRYSFMIKGPYKKVQVQSWPPHLRAAKEVPFDAKPDVWYTMKFKVDVKDGQANLYGKIWPAGESEPEAWTIEQTDPHANETGSPGLCWYATTDCMFDNVQVTLAR